jgi:hypothetical protein
MKNKALKSIKKHEGHAIEVIVKASFIDFLHESGYKIEYSLHILDTIKGNANGKASFCKQVDFIIEDNGYRNRIIHGMLLDESSLPNVLSLIFEEVEKYVTAQTGQKSAFKEEPKEERVLREEKALKDLKELAKAKGYKEGWAIKKQKR